MAEAESKSKVIVVDESAENAELAALIRGNLEAELARNEAEPAPNAAIERKGEKTMAEQKDTYRVVNVMEEIVRSMDIASIMKDNNVCTCSRCQADVMAITLSNLPAKYTVVNTPIAPMLNFYSNKYRMQILSAVMQACDYVNQNPRH